MESNFHIAKALRPFSPYKHSRWSLRNAPTTAGQLEAVGRNRITSIRNAIVLTFISHALGGVDERRRLAISCYINSTNLLGATVPCKWTDGKL